jgi:hypothetical protein
MNAPHPFRINRRELARLGALSIVGGALAPLSLSAPRANAWSFGSAPPRRTARQVLFINLEGGLSQLDSFDAKEGSWTPADFDIRSLSDAGDRALKLPVGVLPRLAEKISNTSSKVGIVRSLAAWDAVHGRAQYYLQTGHPLNASLAKEVPAVGAVVCHELASQRRASDSLPAYISMNMAGNQAGLIYAGFLPAANHPLNLNVGIEPVRLGPTAAAAGDLARRYERLLALDRDRSPGNASLDRSLTGYREFYRGAWSILNDPRLPETLSLTDDDRQRYGATSIGASLALSRNLFRADSGVRFILASHGGFDHHSDIYKENSRNHQTLLRELDAALASLLEDLEAAPSPHDPSRTMLDDTLIVCMGEFGRTPGPISETRQGREHYIHAHCGLFAGGGVCPGALIGATDESGGSIVDFGWSAGRPIYMEDIVCTIYSALGIDWTKVIDETPSGRAFHYVEPASATTYNDFQPVHELFG